jgi:hypothetical protein
MISFRKTPLFASLLTLSGLLALGELYCVYERWTAARVAAHKLVEKQAELAGMRDVVPPPKREIATAIEADLARAQRALAAMQAELKGRGPAAERLRTAKVPTARTDAYFDLATFVEKTRDLARKNDVDVRPDAARFGFGVYAHEGPDVDHIEPVFRQRLVAQYLIEALLDAHPRALLAVKRDVPLSKKERDDRAAQAQATPDNGGAPADQPAEAIASSLPEGADFFVLDPHASVRQPGYVDTTAFRFVFTGQTASLRLFLNRLASFELPVLVREVEVEPASAEDVVAVPDDSAPVAAEAPSTAPSVVLNVEPPPAAAAPKKTAPRVSSAVPIVVKPLSKFTVTVEYIELVPPADDANAAPGAQKSAALPPAAAQGALVSALHRPSSVL